MDGYNVLISRRSIRKYTDEAISEDVMKKVLCAGLSAPSAKNLQPWEFVVVTDRALLDSLAEVRPYWKMLKEAPAAIVTLADLSLYEEGKPSMYVQDCSAATQNLLLAAHALGLGGVWLGLYPYEQPLADVKALLGLPDDKQAISVISIGYPAEAKDQHGEFKPEKVHYNKY